MSEMVAQREQLHDPEAERAELLERFAAHPFANLETYEYFNQKGDEADRAKRDFIDASLKGETPEAPVFAYPNLDIKYLVEQRDTLTELLQDVLRLDMNEEANRLLREKVLERVHEAGIMLLTKLQSDLSPDDPIYPAVSYQLGENMREVYGTPEPEHWRGVLGYRLSLLAEVEKRDGVPPEVQEAWEFVRTRLPTDLPIEKPYEPRPETVAWYRAQLEQRIAPARQALEAAIAAGEIVANVEGKLDSENMVKATQIALAAQGITGWQVEKTKAANLSTSQERKTIFIPETETKWLAVEKFIRIVVAHEIDEHVGRRENGDQTGEPILGGSGCAGSLAWEEGNSKANEAMLEGKLNDAETAFKLYLIGGLALGLDRENHGRNFGEVFDLLWRMRYVANFLDGTLATDGVVAQRKIMDKAVESVRRVFRGTDGRSPGVIFTKDVMTYYLGQADVWRKWDDDMVTLSETERLAEHQLERSAKINPLRPDHRRVAQRALVRSAA